MSQATHITTEEAPPTDPADTIIPTIEDLPPKPEIDPAATAWMHSQDPIPFPLREHYIPSPSPEIRPDYTVPLPPVETVDSDEQLRGVTRLVRRGWEWTEDTSYRGTRQPPFGVRLEQALNFLREEDVDRCRGWEEKLRELEEWLAWIEDGDESRMEERCGVLVRNMLRDVRRKVKGHRLFEEEKYGVVKWGEGVKGTAEVPLPKRGKRRVVRGAPAIEVGERVEDEGARRVLVARPERVHTQFPPADSIVDGDSGEVNWFLKRLNDSEKAFWESYKEDPKDQVYLFGLEQGVYDACSATMGPLQKFKTKDGRGELVLPTDDDLVPPPPDQRTKLDLRLRRCAVERGARRAALQGALRCFTNTEQILATTEWNRVVPAVEQSVLDEVRADLDRNYQWRPAQLDWSTAPVARDKLETMPYTFMWRLRRKLLADLAEHVRKAVNEKNANTRGWVTVPKGATYGGPFVWRMVDPDVQEEQDLLRECEAVFKAIVRTPRTTGEGDQASFLAGVERYAREAALGEYGMSGARGLPEDVQLLPQDWDSAGRLVKSVTREELKWLGFLTSYSVNMKMLRASGETQPKLYSIFVVRLEKAMDDRRADALFLEADQWRTVEELLDVLNRGCDGSEEVFRFSPFQAKYFLERAQEQGLCRYREDPRVYGRVARSIRDIEPLDRIKMADRQRLVYPGDIRSFHQLPTDTADDRQLYRNFFYSLGLRLGVTIFRLRKSREEWRKVKPLSTNILWDALHTFSNAYQMNKEEYCRSQSLASYGLSLAQFVEDVDLPTWESVIPRILGTVSNPVEAMTKEQEEAALEAAALGIIRHKIIKESNENLTMLGRGRILDYKKSDGTNQIVWARDHNWDWASVGVRGKAKQFFSLDRWPLELLSEGTRGRIERDEFVDPNMVLDPVAEDPIPQKYFRAKLRRFGGEEERVRHRPGPAIYPIGDTPLQRKMVRDMLVDRVSRAAGVYPAEKPQTWKQTLADMLPLRRSTAPDDYDMVETSLPEVDPSLVPKSWTPPANPPASHAAGEDSEIEASDVALRSIEDEDDVQMDGA
ncbi:hypothetical protein CONLIGDRAFT_514286 [Coniochaeta ligniaria NRRL 30616]|uniref:Uncharacterized protein n=1 Tax=Coniochaeta ligniaria NRRL 30616 TaxID=1408157 RepID=A0A1J7J9V9_9PEZI|nr:hypothetical protein CONLIGDRAFT_514286 [Coniochaeta ligniaria NRRL 30616]